METTTTYSERVIPSDSFRARLLLARMHRDLTIREAADRCGLNYGSWSNWERGMQPRDLIDVAERIAEGLSIDRDWLIFGGPLAQEVRRRGEHTPRRPPRRETNRGSARTPGRPHAAVKRLSCPPPSGRSEGDTPRTHRPRRLFAHATDGAA